MDIMVQVNLDMLSDRLGQVATELPLFVEVNPQEDIHFWVTVTDMPPNLDAYVAEIKQDVTSYLGAAHDTHIRPADVGEDIQVTWSGFEEFPIKKDGLDSVAWRGQFVWKKK